MLSKSVDEHKRNNLDPVGTWLDMTANYISKVKGKDKNEVREKLKALIADGSIDMKDPMIRHMARENCEDTHPKKTSLLNYIKEIKDNKDILSPTFTTYVNPKVMVSYISEYLLYNMKQRGIVKNEAFVCKVENNLAKSIRLFFKQVGIKLKSNMVSGLFLSKGSVIHIKSAHPTLTSTTRLATSTANTSSERFVAGNRLYLSKEVIIGDILSICNNLYQGDEYKKYEEVIAKYNLTIPSVDDLFGIVTLSISNYWSDIRHEEEILSLLSTLDPVERCAFAYNGDFYHFRKHNESLVRELLTGLIYHDTSDDIIENVRERIRKFDDAILDHIHLVYYYELRGLGKNYDDYSDVLVSRIYRSSVKFNEALVPYKELFDSILLNYDLPPNVYDVKNQVRYAVAGSDTDSGLKTLVKWVEWYQGNDDITREGIGISSSLVFLCSKLLAHYLRQISTNMGIPRSHIKDRRISMKPEFAFLTFGLMSISKHYYAGVNVQEGNVFDKFEIEIKGVSLRNSSTPKPVRDLSRYLLHLIIDNTEKNKKIPLKLVLDKVTEMEDKIHTSIHASECDYLRTIIIKDTNDYKLNDPKDNVHKHCIIWNNTFGKKYGYTATVPYRAVKIPTVNINKSKIAGWIHSIDDKELSKGLIRSLNSFKINKLPIMYIPLEYVESYGIPKEITPVIDTKRVILDLVNMCYIILESLGIYKKPHMTLTEMRNEHGERITYT